MTNEHRGKYYYAGLWIYGFVFKKYIFKKKLACVPRYKAIIVLLPYCIKRCHKGDGDQFYKRRNVL